MGGKSRIRETPNLSNDADSSTNIFVSACVKKEADSIFFPQEQLRNTSFPLEYFMPIVDIFLCAKMFSTVIIIVIFVFIRQRTLTGCRECMFFSCFCFDVLNCIYVSLKGIC